MHTGESSVPEIRDLEERLSDPIAIGPKELIYFRSSLQKLLATDPQAQILLESAENALPHVTELVTGVPVYNLPMNPVSQKLGDFVCNGLRSAVELTQSGQTVNIRPFVQACDERGPFVGFRKLLTNEQYANLDSADHELAQHCYEQFSRLCLGHEVEKICTAMDRAVQEEILPLIGKIQNTDSRKSIEKGLALWESNKGNPWRNVYFRTNRTHRLFPNVHRQYAAPLMEKNPEYFSCGKIDGAFDVENIGAGYDPTKRVLLLRMPSHGDSYDLLETLDLVHELVHIQKHNEQIEQYRKNGSLDMRNAHAASISRIERNCSTGFADMNEDPEAFANIIELLLARIGFGTHSPQSVCQTLGIHPTDHAINKIETLIKLAQLYFDGGGRKDSAFPRDFVQYIEEMYRRLGMSIL